jgi:hypothetical protein
MASHADFRGFGESVLKYKDFPDTYLVGITPASSDAYELAQELRTRDC